MSQRNKFWNTIARKDIGVADLQPNPQGQKRRLPALGSWENDDKGKKVSNLMIFPGWVVVLGTGK